MGTAQPICRGTVILRTVMSEDRDFEDRDLEDRDLA